MLELSNTVCEVNREPHLDTKDHLTEASEAAGPGRKLFRLPSGSRSTTTRTTLNECAKNSGHYLGREVATGTARNMEYEGEGRATYSFPFSAGASMMSSSTKRCPSQR